MEIRTTLDALALAVEAYGPEQPTWPMFVPPSPINQVSYLASLTALTELVVAGNPVASEEGYRRRILSLLPSLTILDHA